jgi:uncharacterized membrane protein YqjE
LTQTGGLFSSLRGFAATGVALFRTRLELLKIESREEVGRVAGLLMWGMAAVLLGVVGVVFLAVFVTVLLWETQRVLALGIFSALFLAAAAVAIASALRLHRQGSRLFAASLAELRHDENVLKSGDPQP